MMAYAGLKNKKIVEKILDLNFFKKNKLLKNLKESTATTISAQVAVTPLILYTMGNFSIVALPVNILILLFIPITMLFGFLTGIAGFVSGVLSTPFGWISYAFLAYELWVVKIFADLPFAQFQVPKFSVITMFIMYIIIIFFFKLKNNQLN